MAVDARPTVHASPAGLRLMIDNLLQNAVRHGRHDDALRMRVRVEATDTAARLVVEDDGPGIPEADRERMTERFVRGAGATRQGSGLGLSIVAQQVERAGGRLQITSTPDSGGARIVVELPADPSTDGRVG